MTMRNIETGRLIDGLKLDNLPADVNAELALKADKTNVLELDNTTAFTPDADYEPATKKYVDESVGTAPVTSVNGKTGVVVLDKTDIGLDNVDNTSDASKPVSTDTQTALDAKVTSVVAGSNITVDNTDPINPVISADGDMTKVTYDPNTVSGDAFDMDNMAESATKKVLTATERTNLGNQSGSNTGDETAGSIKTKYESNADTNAFTDAEKTNLSNQSGTNTGDQDLSGLMDKATYDPTNVGADVFDSANTVYDPTLSGLSTTTVKTAIDEIQINNPGIQFDITKANPAHSEGELFYDKTKKSISYYNEESDITLNIGQELVFRIYNNTGSTIVNGAIVTNTSTGIQLADNRFKDKANLIAMATHDIEDATFGYATRLGEVGGIDTSMCSAGTVVYLGTDGGYSQTKTDDGHYSVILGVCKVVSATEGVIQFNPVTSQLTVEVTDTNGFPSTERADTTLTFVDGTRTFTIAPSTDDFHYYELGDKYEKETSESIIIANTEGLHAIYYDGETLSELVNPNSSQIEMLIITKCLIAYIYWDATNSAHSYFADERHGISMSPTTHAYLHFSRGAQFITGGGLGDFDLGGADSDDSSAQFSVASVTITDEDIRTTSDAILSTTGLPIYYLEGTTPNLRRVVQSGFACYNTGSISGRIFFNELVGTTWQLSEVAADNDFVLMHIFAINGVEGEDKIVSVMGQNEYVNRTDARDGASSEISNIIGLLPFEEIVPLGTVIFKTNDGYGNGVNARVQDNDEGLPYTDWRSSDLAQGANPSSHANLTDVELAGTGVNQGHIDYQAQTIYGVKTFNSPVVSTTASLTNSTNKNLVSDSDVTNLGNLSGTNTGDQTSIVGITGTKAQFDTAVTDGNIVYDGDTISGSNVSGDIAGDAANVTGTVAIANGGTGQTTQQTAIDALTNVSAATNEYVLTKDTTTGNAVFKALAGGGDMLASTYDPTSVSGDAFDMENMVEGATKKILTTAERTILSNTSNTNTGDQTSIVGITGTKSQFDTAVTDGNITYDGDNVSVLTNDANYITSAGAPVQSVNSATGTVVLDADDISDAATTNKFVTATDLTVLSNTSNTNTGDQTSIVGITGTTAEFNTALSDGSFATGGGTATGTNTGDNTVCTSGAATTAETLLTARTIGGVSFDGSANIDLPGVNTAGNQNTSGQAATVATITGLAPNTATTQATQPNITSAVNLATVGTIGTGTWQGTAVADTYISSASTWNAKQDALTFGIANTNAVDIDSASVTNGEYAKFTANGLESKTFAEVKTDLSLNSVENTAISTWAGSANITTVGEVSATGITLPTNGQIKLTIPTTDSHATGNVTSEFNAGVTTAIGNLVYLSSSGTWLLADKGTSAATYSSLLGIALEVKTSGNALKVALAGSYVYSTAFPTLTIGAPVYMDDAGAMVVTQPTTTDEVIRIIGYGVHADKIYFNPSNDYITHA